MEIKEIQELMDDPYFILMMNQIILDAHDENFDFSSNKPYQRRVKKVRKILSQFDFL